MYDAIFVLGDEYSTFTEVIDAFKTTARCLSPSIPDVQSLRFSLGQHQDTAIALPQNKLLHRGYMYAGPSTASGTYFDALILQCQSLHQQKIGYRMTADHFFRHGSTQLISNGNFPMILIPFEDKVENASRFFGQYVPTFAAHMNMFPTVIRKEFEKFYDHCLKQLSTETPFVFDPKQILGLIKAPTTYHFTPKKGQVGRHSIFKELEITHPQASIKDLLPIFCSMIGLGRLSAPDLYFQYFTEPNIGTSQYLSPEYLRETTFDLDRLTYQEWNETTEKLRDKPITDAFCVLEHKHVAIETDTSVLYTMRKVPNSGFELRANITWNQEPQQSPEELIEAFEEKSNISWMRIV